MTPESTLSSLEGSAAIDKSAATIARVERDFGNLVTGRARGVVRPQSLLELSKVVGAAKERREALTVRGGGLSQGGQSLPDNSLVVDMSGWKQIDDIDVSSNSVTCGPGVSWRELLLKTLPFGLVPKVHPLNLDLTIGGTLSAGGMGTTSHRHGFAASQIVSARVVLGTGELVATGPSLEREVFDSVFGGCGRVGIIGSVELSLEPAPEHVHTVVLRYDTAAAMLRDLEFLSRQAWAYHVGTMCCAGTHGLRRRLDGRREPLRVWSFGLELARRGAEAIDNGQLDALHFVEVLHEETDDLASFLARYDGRFEMMRATGTWDQAHPWFEALVPFRAAEAVLRKVMELPLLFGDGHRVAVVADTERPMALSFPGAGPAAVIAVLPIGVAPSLVPRALDAIAELDAYILGLGGCRYVSGWLSLRRGFTWQQHYAGRYPKLLELKSRFDPENLFRSQVMALAEGA